MFLRRTTHLDSTRMSQQSGFLIPVALFAVLGLGVLALSIAQMNSGAKTAVFREAISVQALYAADSGVNYALNQLLFDASSQLETDTRCTAVDGNSLSFNVSGLSACSVELNCAQISNSGGTARIYQLQSSASCGSGELLGERIISVKASYE